MKIKSKEQRQARARKRKLEMTQDTVTNFNKRRLAWGLLIVVALFSFLVYRLAYWQVVRADDLQERAVLMQKEDAELDPVRGAIYDANMKPLAQTVTKYELYGYTQYLYKSDEIKDDEREKTIKDLAKITGVKEDEIKEKLEGEDNLVKLASGLTQDQIQQAKDKFGDNVTVHTSVTRNYPNGDYASHVIGCVNDENSGRIGLEYEYNSTLAGVKGRVVRNIDSQGNTLSLGSSKYYDAQDGYNIVTTIDTVIQSYVEEEIKKGMKTYGAESIACIVMDPKTGDILAMAKTPSFDPNEPGMPADESDREKFDAMSAEEQSDYLSRMWTNTSVSSVYEPGSTFKLICSSAGLDSGTTTMKSHFKCPGYITIDGVSLFCADNHVHGDQDLSKAVGNSCNVAMSEITMDMGRDTYYKYIKLYGFRDYTNIDLPGEAMSIVKNKDDMTNVDFVTMGFGQGISVTPIQMITAISSIANDGILMQPKLVKQIVDNDGNVVEEKEDVEVRQVLSKETAEEMKDVMLASVEDGGGLNAYVPGYRVGGKTGTADIPDETGGYQKKGSISSFVAVAPMDDPEISVIVIVTKPTKGISLHGAYNAAPMAGSIIEKTLVYRGIERKYSDKDEEKISAEEVTVPDVTGQNSKAAITNLKAYGFKYKIEPESTTGEFQVVDQYPKAGQKAAKGSTVYIYSK